MNIEFEMLKAQIDALRVSYLSLIESIHHGDAGETWLSKYLLWGFERGNLCSSGYNTPESSPGKDMIDRRRFQLQVLMDVAYIRGGLEGYDIQRRISAPDRELAEAVYRGSDGSEEQMVRMIDKHCN